MICDQAKPYLAGLLMSTRTVGVLNAQRVYECDRERAIYLQAVHETLAFISMTLGIESANCEHPPLGKSAIKSARRLTKRQRQIAPLIVAGLSNEEIANRIGRDVDTVRTHRAALFKRLGVHSVDELEVALLGLPAA